MFCSSTSVSLQIKIETEACNSGNVFQVTPMIKHSRSYAVYSGDGREGGGSESFVAIVGR